MSDHICGHPQCLLRVARVPVYDERSKNALDFLANLALGHVRDKLRHSSPIADNVSKGV